MAYEQTLILVNIFRSLSASVLRYERTARKRKSEIKILDFGENPFCLANGHGISVFRVFVHRFAAYLILSRLLPEHVEMQTAQIFVSKYVKHTFWRDNRLLWRAVAPILSIHRQANSSIKWRRVDGRINFSFNEINICVCILLFIHLS